MVYCHCHYGGWDYKLSSSCLYIKLFIQSSHYNVFSVHSSHRSRDEDRVSKPGAMSTPVKSSDDGVLSQASDQASSRDEKILPPLPGTNSLVFSAVAFVFLYCNSSTVLKHQKHITVSKNVGNENKLVYKSGNSKVEQAIESMYI